MSDVRIKCDGPIACISEDALYKSFKKEPFKIDYTAFKPNATEQIQDSVTKEINKMYENDIHQMIRSEFDPYTYVNLRAKINSNRKAISMAAMTQINPKIAIKKVIFNDPATIVFWLDGTKTVVKQQSCDKKKKFDPEKGLAMAIAKKALGNQGNYFNVIREWVDTYDSKKKEKKPKKENK